MNHWIVPASHRPPFTTKSSSPLSPTPRRKPAARSSLSILTASVCMKNAVLLTFLMYWQLLPVKPLFLKGMLLWEKPWNIHWHRLQDRFHKESHAELCSSPGTASAPSTSLCPDDQVQKWRRETKPRCKGRSHSHRWENQLVQGEAFHLPVLWSRSWRDATLVFLSLLDPSPWILPFLPLIKYAYLYSFFSKMKWGDIWCCWVKQHWRVHLSNPKAVPLQTGRRQVRK